MRPGLDGAVVLARSQGTSTSAIGGGGEDQSFGSLEVAGEVYLRSGNLRVTEDADFTVTETGRIMGSAEEPTIGADIIGAGQIDNRGVIALDAENVYADDVAVHGHHYQVEVDEADLVVSSSVDTDVIDGLTVRFPTASPHVLTVTHQPTGVSAEVTVEVTAAPAPTPEPEPVEAGSLPSTGGPAAGWIAAALALIVTGGLALTRGRRVSGRPGS